MTEVTSPQPLSRTDIIMRTAGVACVLGILAALRWLDPESLSWFPLRTSCGAVTGLPCLFCGITRAMHHLIQGEFARAIYFNWLAIPLTLAAIALVLISSGEVALGRRVLQGRLRFRLTSPRIAAIAGGIAALWVLQVSLAVGLHKTELLNPAGPLYGLFVR